MGLGVESSGFDKQKEVALIAELDSIQAKFNDALKGIFGMQLEWDSTSSVGGEITKGLLSDFLHRGLSILKEQQQILRESKHYTQAMNLDIVDDDTLTVTDFERAIEFLDETTPRKSDTSLRKILRLVIQDAKDRVDDISPMPRKKPSAIFPQGALRFPIFGVYDRSIWSQQQSRMQQDTLQRIDDVEAFANKNMKSWASQGTPNLLEIERT